ncbi:LAFE_0G10374g1_1 [Lachancea fermentati]|uniref:rRNA methyltransferase 1, mitochondrial n=1 Tax=Lachancea fermentati TaxID=4955 RepID=A0A1G4MHP1_LACFM|nr:LAFE_0G10374g1_1 [Lachancea fermentati]
MNFQLLLVAGRRYLSRAVKPAVKIPNERQKASPTNFNKNFPQHRRVKAWERDGEDKDTWFRRKYAHVHTKDKNRQDPFGKREAHERKVRKEQENLREQHREHKSKFQRNPTTLALKRNPLMEYVYGINSVTAALQVNKRDYFSRLLHYSPLPETLKALAKDRGTKIEEVDKHRLNLLTNYGVHNNVVLETKPLQPIEISHLGACDDETKNLQYSEVYFDEQLPRTMPFVTKSGKHFPLGLYLDEVVDPHNVGAIARTAYFLGVDFLVMSRRNCAPLSPVANKTSSGAIELLPIFVTDKPLEFFSKSQQEGAWSFVTSGLVKDSKYTRDKKLSVEDLHGMLQELPVMLVVGNEGTGVRTNLQMRSDFLVEIPAGRGELGTGGVDSLNVSVATAILLNALLN